MSGAGTGDHTRARRRLDAVTRARISPLPPPQEVFADWLLSVPADADLEAAAHTQIALIDTRGMLHPDVLCLRAMLVAVAGSGSWTCRTGC